MRGATIWSSIESAFLEAERERPGTMRTRLLAIRKKKKKKKKNIEKENKKFFTREQIIYNHKGGVG